ncbi:MAG: tRNA (adenosine(37)-N6)-threonylcarbamoyltransferase complex ATPase subunit type 1 TsaE [Prevotellaceae bacterium]|nr:tRNA (adenosine(37)-N6)-threonylcarbamoyltransferase complex ATPase subunit type 1 TsaE [Prevotellaceae bacterium]
MQIKISSLDGLGEAARQFHEAMGSHTVFALHGAMGAGKTTFVKALCQELGVSDTVCSPSFAIINEYETPQGEPVYHFDFYRLSKTEEALDIGCLDYFSSGRLCLIEWPELVESLLPPEAVHVSFTVQPDGTRILSF